MLAKHFGIRLGIQSLELVVRRQSRERLVSLAGGAASPVLHAAARDGAEALAAEGQQGGVLLPRGPVLAEAADELLEALLAKGGELRSQPYP